MNTAIAAGDLRTLAVLLPPVAALYRTRGGMSVIVADERGPIWHIMIGERRCWFVGSGDDARVMASQAGRYQIEQRAAIDANESPGIYDCIHCGG